jgi:hypothetical protein
MVVPLFAGEVREGGSSKKRVMENWNGPLNWSAGIDHNKLLIASANVNGIEGKKAELAEFVDGAQPAVFLIQETRWRKDQLAAGLPGYSCQRKERSSGNGGGVAAFVHGDFTCLPIKFPANTIEITGWKVKHGNNAWVTTVSLYRPPGPVSSDVYEVWEDSLVRCLSSLGTSLDTTVLMGDVNVPLGTEEGQRLEGLLADLGLTALPLPPTHGDPSSSSSKTIDWISIGSSLKGTFGLGSGFERSSFGHQMLWVRLSVDEVERRMKTRQRIRLYGEADEEGMIRDLRQEHDRISSCAQTSPSVATSILSFKISEVVDNYIPTRWGKISARYKFKASQSAKDLGDLKRESYSKYKDALSKYGSFYHETKALHQLYKEIYNRSRNLVRKEMAKFVSEGFSACKTVKEWWDFLRHISGKSKSARGLLPSPALLAEHFKRVYDQAKAYHVASNLPGAGAEAQPLQPQSEERQRYDRDSILAMRNDVEVASRTRLSAEEEVCSEVWARGCLKRLKPNLGAGLDGLNGRLARLLRDAIASPIASIVTGAMNTGLWPVQWKEAKIIPVEKTADAGDDPSKYRPICILPLASKVGEHWLKERLERQYKPSARQFGFRRSCGVADAQGTLQTTLAKMLSDPVKPRGVSLLSLDIQKAFDSVCHNTLDKALRKAGVSEKLRRLLRDYVKDRRLKVITEEGESTFFGASVGVPQGSVLGPLLFSAYINGAISLTLTPEAELLTYADDCLIMNPWYGDDDGAALQHNASAFEEQLRNIGLQLNPAKCHCMHFRLNNLPPPNFVTKIGGAPVETVTEMRWLGVIWDCKGVLDKHWDPKITQGKAAAFVGHATYGKYLGGKKWLNSWAAVFESRISWCWQSVQPRTKRQLSRLSGLDSHTAHLAARKSWTTPTSDCLKQLGKMPIAHRMLVSGLNFAYQNLHQHRAVPATSACDPPEDSAHRYPQRLNRHQFASDSKNYHRFQLLDPTNNSNNESCARLRSLPMLRTIRLWNAAVFSEADLLKIGEKKKSLKNYLKDNIVRIMENSAERWDWACPGWRLESPSAD